MQLEKLFFEKNESGFPVIPGSATEIDFESVETLPVGVPLSVLVECDGKLYGVQIAKTVDTTVPSMYEEWLQFAAVTPEGPIPTLRMAASISRDFTEDAGYMMRFNIKTRTDGEVYPPFQAAEFIKWAYNYFSRSHNITTLAGEWRGDADSTNYQQYINNLRKSKRKDDMGRVLAARNTWTGRQFGGLGFNTIQEIIEVSSAFIEQLTGVDEPDVVYVYFKKRLIRKRTITKAPLPGLP